MIPKHILEKVEAAKSEHGPNPSIFYNGYDAGAQFMYELLSPEHEAEVGELNSKLQCEVQHANADAKQLESLEARIKDLRWALQYTIVSRDKNIDECIEVSIGAIEQDDKARGND